MGYAGQERNPQIIKQAITRIPISPGQLSLYKVLYEAGKNALSTSKLAKRMRWGDKKGLTGVLGALGHRINNTTEALKQAKPGIELFFNVSKYGDEWRYSMRPELRAAIDDLPELRSVFTLTVDEIYKKYDRGRKHWLVIETDEAAQIKIPY
jgi:hypothetical protein